MKWAAWTSTGRGWAQAACWMLAGLGVVLRVYQLGFPARLTMDEQHFVPNARAYLMCRPDLNDHPALGKLLMSVSMLVVGDAPLGWRLVALLSGLANIVLVAEIAERCFPSGNGRAIGAALCGLDGLYLAYSRVALLDGPLAAVSLALVLLALSERSDVRRSALGGGLIAAAGSIKWTGFTLLLPWAFAMRRARWRGLIVALGAAAALTFVVASVGLALRCEDFSPSGVLREMSRLYERHASVRPSVSDRLASRWWTWLWMDNPILLRMDYVGERRRYASTLTSPLLWWLSSAAAIAATLAAIATTIQALRGRGAGPLRYMHPERIACVALCFWAPILPWMVVSRPSYIYHFMPSHGVALGLLAGLLGAASSRWPRAGWAVVIVLLATALPFVPIASQMTVPAEYFRSLLWMRNWA